MSALTSGAKIATRTKVSRELGERRPTDDGLGFRRVVIGTETADVELWIDCGSVLRQLEIAAMRSKTNTAKRMGGAIVVKAVNRNREIRS